MNPMLAPGELGGRIADIEAVTQQALERAMRHGDEHWIEGSDPIRPRAPTGTGMPTHVADEGTFYWDTDANLLWVSLGAGVWRPIIVPDPDKTLVHDEWDAIPVGWNVLNNQLGLNVTKFKSTSSTSPAWAWSVFFRFAVSAWKEINLITGLKIQNTSDIHERHGMAAVTDTTMSQDAEFANGVYFRAGADGDSNWYAITQVSSSETAVDTGVAASGFQVFHIRRPTFTSGTKYQFRIDDVLVAELTGPDSGFLSPFYQVFAQTGTDKELQVDFSTRSAIRGYPSNP